MSLVSGGEISLQVTLLQHSILTYQSSESSTVTLKKQDHSAEAITLERELDVYLVPQNTVSVRTQVKVEPLCGSQGHAV